MVIIISELPPLPSSILNYKCSHDGNLGDRNRSLPEVISFADHCPGTLSAIQPGVQDTASKRQGKKLCSLLFSLFTLYRDSLFFPHIEVPSLQGSTTPHHTTPRNTHSTQHRPPMQFEMRRCSVRVSTLVMVVY